MTDQNEVYRPKGIEFYDKGSDRQMIFVDKEDERYAGWIFFKHPDGQWVTLREATEEDKLILTKEIDSQERIK